ncbi:MAG TPA: 16S rRNA (cytosine(967)-C(5))-methyltransferase RsmB [Solirubrobacterales bacterium]|nr:16S rRNA (cytosine(967)-C(5))-methyltransferase RsmB [Solirubrobacterales bacterium]
MSTAPREVAFRVVGETFEDGAFTDLAFRAAADSAGLEGRERAQAQRLAYGAVQRLGTSDALVRRLAGRSPRLLDPPVRTALRLGLFELLFSDATPDRAVVNEAVDLVKAAGAAHAAGFVNAVLRRAGREREELIALLADDSDPESASVAHSVPRWLAELWWKELGPQAARPLLAAGNRAPERAFRVNPGRVSRAEAIERLRTAGAAAVAADGPWPLAAPEILVVERGIAPALPLVGGGLLTPQSRASAGVVEALDPQPGEQVLDLCAGPGTKTGQIAARVGKRGNVVSVEVDEARAGEVARQAERLGLRNVTIFEVDAAETVLDRGFDRVLLDAPCSDLGTLAARPDARWRKSPEGIARLVRLQETVLANAARALRPGGILVYSTCTISRAENEERVAALLAAAGEGDLPLLETEDLGSRSPDVASPQDPRFLQTRPDLHGTSGFFVARLRRADG